MTYSEFRFESYEFNGKRLNLSYSYDGILSFTESYLFDFDFAPDWDSPLLERAFQNLFLMAGVSYYKAYIPPKIVLPDQVKLDETSAAFFEETYQKGLGEFFYVNQLDPATPVTFPANSPPLPPILIPDRKGMLVGIGGGKDSLVSVEALREHNDIATWSVGHKSQLLPLTKRIGLQHFWVERQWDRSLLEHNAKGAFNGHVPISAILASVGVIVALLSGYRDIVVSNEHSADEPTLHYKNTDINHQYSKSSQFEASFQKYIKRLFGPAVRYYSTLRPYSELRIAEFFSNNTLEKYKDVFSSCNRAFTHSSDRIFWCGECPKCAFVFLALTPFIKRHDLENLFGGKNLLLDPSLEPLYRQLLGIEGEKPLECIGEIKESRSAMRLAQKLYPALQKYEFELQSDYDFRTEYPHLMPDEVYGRIRNSLR